MRRTKRDENMLTPREAMWIGEYIATSSKKKASAFARYSAPIDLLKRPHVAREVGKRMEKIMSRKAVTGERVIAELAKIAFANIDDFVDDEYRIGEKPKRRKMAAVQSVETEITQHGTGDDTEDVKRVKLKMYDKKAALDSLGRHFGLFKDRIELSGDLGERLNRAYDRLANEGAEPATGEE